MHIIKVSIHVQHCKRCPFAGGMRKLLVIHDAVLASSNESPSMTVHYNEFAITSIVGMFTVRQIFDRLNRCSHFLSVGSGSLRKLCSSGPDYMCLSCYQV